MSSLETKIHGLADGGIVFESTQDCNPVIEDILELREDKSNYSGKDMHHVARIPFVIIEQYLNNNNIQYEEFMRDKTHIKNILNDPALSAFRIWQGRV